MPLAIATPGIVGAAAAVTTRNPRAYRCPATLTYEVDHERVPAELEFVDAHRVVSLATEATNAVPLSLASTVQSPIRHNVGVAPAAVDAVGTHTCVVVSDLTAVK
jgi:hypothetical protein